MVSHRYRAYLQTVNDRIHVTPAQEAYIRRLRAECFVKRVVPEYGPTTKYRQLRTAATAEIEMLRRVLGKDVS